MKYLIFAVIAVIILVVIYRLQIQKPASGTNTAIKTPYTGPKPLLRQFGDLTPKDFESHPVWVNCHVIDYEQPWYSETDEETFRPWLEATPADPELTMFLVRASLRLADGTLLTGFITPQSLQENNGKPDLGLIQPQLFLPSGKRIAFWYGVMPMPKNEISEFYSAIGKTEANVFPLTFNAEPGLAIGISSGVVPGFCSIGEGNEIKIQK